MIYLTFSTIISSIILSSNQIYPIEWKGLDLQNPELAYNTLEIGYSDFQEFLYPVSMSDCIYYFSYVGQVADLNIPTSLVITTYSNSSGSFKELKNTIIQLTGTLAPSVSNAKYLRYNLAELTGVTTWADVNRPTYRFVVELETTALAGGGVQSYISYTQQLYIPTYNSFTDTNNILNNKLSEAYQNGYNVGFKNGQSSTTCAGVEEQNVFDLLKTAFTAPLALFNIQLMPGLTLGTLLLLPVAIAVLFAIWRLLT